MYYIEKQNTKHGGIPITDATESTDLSNYSDEVGYANRLGTKTI
jgi:hypothetical protein